MIPIPASSSSQGAKLPTAASSLPGRPKIAAPIMPLSASSAAPQMPTSRRVVTADRDSSAIQRSNPALERLNQFVDMLDMGPERENRASNMELAVDPRSAQHDASFLQQM